MSSHKGPVVAQGNGAPASNGETDTVELAELGPLLEEKGKRGIADPAKVSSFPESFPPSDFLLEPLPSPLFKLSTPSQKRKQAP